MGRRNMPPLNRRVAAQSRWHVGKRDSLYAMWGLWLGGEQQNGLVPFPAPRLQLRWTRPRRSSARAELIGCGRSLVANSGGVAWRSRTPFWVSDYGAARTLPLAVSKMVARGDRFADPEMRMLVGRPAVRGAASFRSPRVLPQFRRRSRTKVQGSPIVHASRRRAPTTAVLTSHCV